MAMKNGSLVPRSPAKWMNAGCNSLLHVRFNAAHIKRRLELEASGNKFKKRAIIE
jgi:hypothetical protein